MPSATASSRDSPHRRGRGAASRRTSRASRALSGGSPSSATMPAMPHISARARAAAGSCPRRPDGSTRARTEPSRWRRAVAPRVASSSAARMPSAIAAGSGSTRKQTSSVKHLRMRPDARGDQRLAARELLVDLERRVRACRRGETSTSAAAVRRNASRLVHAPGQEAAIGEAERHGQRLHARHLLRRAADDEQERASGRRFTTMANARPAECPALIGLERARVQTRVRAGRRLEHPSPAQQPRRAPACSLAASRPRRSSSRSADDVSRRHAARIA